MTTGKTRLMRGGITLILAFIAGISLSACSDYALLDSDQVPEDELPADVSAVADLIDPTSSRLAAKDGDVSFWLARDSQERQICLVVHEPPDAWQAGCGIAGGKLSTSNSFGSFVVQPDQYDPPEEMTEISINIYRQ